MNDVRLPGLLIVVLSLCLVGSAVHAACDDGTGDDDTINCSDSDTDGVDAGDGNDSVTVEPGAEVLNDSEPVISAGDGHDTVVNNGRVDGSQVGVDLGSGNDSLVNNDRIFSGNTYVAVIGGSGNDTIVNNGVIESGYDGITPDEGDDLIMINGTLRYNDTSGGYGIYDPIDGNDTVIVNGTIAPIDGESSYYSVYTGNGEDSVVINGTATLNGDVDTGSGDDNVTVQVGATVIGIIDGGEGGGGSDGTPCVDEGVPCDTLFFHFATANEAEYEAAAAAFAAQLSNADPDGGSFTYGGQTYTWVNFEQLKWLVELLLRQAAAGQSSFYGGATHTCTDTYKQVFILENGDVDVYAGFNENPNGFQVAYISVALLPGTTHFATDPDGWYVEVVPLGDIYYRIDVYTAPGVRLPDPTPCLISTNGTLTGFAAF